MIYVASDHAGFELKNRLVLFAQDNGYALTDLGAHSLDKDDDYPEFAKRVAQSIKDDNDKGILVCGSGQGVCIAANKFDGIRAAEGWSVETAKLARNDDNANVLCLAATAQTIDPPQEILKAFLETNFKNEERYQRRIEEIADIEKNN